MDRFTTHVISSILNIGQNVVQEWPLYILDNSGGKHSVLLKPGEMIWYESARAPHGRPQHFDGEFFDNLFVHYRPTGSVWYSQPWQIGHRPQEHPLTAEALRDHQKSLGL